MQRLAQLPPRLTMLMSFAGTSILNYIFGVATGWLLVPGDYGLIGFAQTIILICSLVLNSGLAWSLTAQLAEAPAEERPALVRGAMLMNSGLTVLVAAVVILLFASGVLRTGLESWSITLIIVSALPFLSLIAIANGAVRGAEAFGSVAAIKVFEVVFKTIAGIGLVLLGWEAAGALMGVLIGSIAAALLALWRLNRVLQMPLFGHLRYPSWRLAGGMFGGLLGMALLLNLDILFVKSLATDSRDIAGFYQSAIMLANMPYYMATAMFGVLFPQLARQTQPDKTVSAVADTLRIILIFLFHSKLPF